ncbi:MAG TPA: hypothetical protein PLP27_11005 [Crocinitomicaceae bacterium]|nr:hypothetical protein [Crocinitomicaceae bacterium]
MQTQKANASQPNNSKLSLQVMDNLTVQVLPNTEHEFLMTTNEVAEGYGISEYTIRRHKMEKSELVEGTHFITAVSILNGKTRNALKIPHNTTLWTKRGIIRLGFFITSSRAKLFRDWAENLIIKLDQQANLFGDAKMVVKNPALPEPRKHNRLTSERIIDILIDVAQIEDRELRLSIINKLRP